MTRQICKPRPMQLIPPQLHRLQDQSGRDAQNKGPTELLVHGHTKSNGTIQTRVEPDSC